LHRLSGRNRGTGIEQKKPGRREFYIAAFAALAADQGSKALVKVFVPYGHTVAVIRGVFDISPEGNPGAAFGMLQNWGSLLAIISLVVIFALVKFRMQRSRSRLLAIALGLLLGGAFGNLIDRLALGAVYDFLDFHKWPVFNLADAAVTIGGALLVIYWMVVSRESHGEQ
jgi:signal peptidase II